MRLRYMVLCLFVLVFFCSSSIHAQRFFFSREGLTVPIDDDSKESRKGGETQKKLTFKEQMARDANAAAAKGYKVGQTVKEKDGFVYVLAKDSKTGGYTFRLFRKGDLKSPKEAMAKTSKVSQKEKERLEKETREKEKALALKKKEEERLRKEKELKERTRKEKERKERKRKAKEEEERLRKEKEQKARIAAEDKIIREAEIEAEKREAKRPKAKKPYQAYNKNDNQRLKRGEWAVGYEHSYLKWKTVLTKRLETTASGTENVTDGVGEKDLYYTKAHGDMLLVRYKALRRLELFLEAGLVYESLSEISDMESALGGGFQYSVKEVEFPNDAGLYLDFTARYMAGKVAGTYADINGNKFNRSSDFNEIEAGLEAGFRLFQLTLYGSVTYGLFSEETKREQVLSDPMVRILNDELEEQENFGTMLGLNCRINDHWTVDGQWHSGFKEGALVNVQYRF